MWSLKSLIALTSMTVILGASFLDREPADGGTLHLEYTAKQIENSPPCIRLFSLLEKYSDQYDVPFEIAIGVAREETGYLGPFHWAYDPKRVSSASAYGAMQVQVPTANDQWESPVTSAMLLNDMDLNVHISMKLLARLKKKYGSWEVALGAYNSGKPIINAYATRIARGLSNPLRKIST